MRELSFSQLWPKLAQPRFTTFRFTRRDRDWQVGETVRVMFKARSRQNRSVLGQAVITAKVARQVEPIHYSGNIAPGISRQEAQADGFNSIYEMRQYLWKGYHDRVWHEAINKLTLNWTQIWLFVPEQKPIVAAHWATVLIKGDMGHCVHGQGPQYVMHQEVLTDIHNVAALGDIVV